MLWVHASLQVLFVAASIYLICCMWFADERKDFDENGD
jgi:hypothetical protein